MKDFLLGTFIKQDWRLLSDTDFSLTLSNIFPLNHLYPHLHQTILLCSPWNRFQTFIFYADSLTYNIVYGRLVWTGQKVREEIHHHKTVLFGLKIQNKKFQTKNP